MSVASIVRLISLMLAIAAVVLGAEIGSANNEPTVAAAKTSAVWDAFNGRLCPREVGYGKFDQPITLQDI